MTENDSYRNNIDDKLTIATIETQRLHSRVDETDSRVTKLQDDVGKHTELFGKTTIALGAINAKLNEHDEAFRLNNILLGLTMIIAIVGLFT